MRKELTLCENTTPWTASARGIQEGMQEEVSHRLLFVPIRISVTRCTRSLCEPQWLNQKGVSNGLRSLEELAPGWSSHLEGGHSRGSF